MNCSYCPIRDDCACRVNDIEQVECCFGTGNCNETVECPIREKCQACQGAGTAIAIEYETPGYRCFAKSHAGWDAATDSPCSICDLYLQCKETHIDRKGLVAILEET